MLIGLLQSKTNKLEFTPEGTRLSRPHCGQRDGCRFNPGVPSMSQLDFSITFSHFSGFVMCFYVFSHYMAGLLIRFWYNQKARVASEVVSSETQAHADHSVFLKRILTL